MLYVEFRSNLTRKIFVAVLACVAAAGFSARAWAQASVNEGLETASIYVDAVRGSDSNSGTQSSPLKTIGAAVTMAKANNRASIGTHVYINPGTYREFVEVVGDARSTTLPTTFEGTQPGKVIISGADLITGWTKTSGNASIYQTAWPYDFGICAEAAEGAPFEQEIVLHQEMLIVNGTPMTQVLTLSSMLPGTFFVDATHNLVYVYPPSGANMSTAVIETATRPTIMHEVGLSYAVFRGLTFQYANTCHGDSAVKIDSNPVNVLFDNVSVSWNNAMGLSFASVENFTVQNSVAHHNGELGFHSHQTKKDLWQNNVSNYNNWRGAQGAFYMWDTGGAKYMWDHQGTYKNTSAYFNQANGISWDTDQENVTVTGLVSADNIGNGVQIEKTQGPLTISGSSVCYSNLIGVTQRGGIVVRNSPQVKISGTAMFSNGTNQLAVVGEPGGIEISNWETGQNYNLITSNLTLTGNSLYGNTPNVFSDSYLGDTDWTKFVTTLSATGNKYYAGSDSSTPAWALPGGSVVDFSTWKTTTGEDGNSSWSTTAAPAACSTQADSKDFWLVTSDYAGVTLDPTGNASFHLTTFGLGGISGTVKLSVDGISQVPGLSGSFSQTNISTSGSGLLNVAGSTSIKPGTYPLTVLGNVGNMTRTMTVSLVVPTSSVRLSASTLTFPNTIVQTTSAAQTIKLTNIGKTALAISSISVKGNYAQTNNCGTSLGAGANCTITVTFTPKIVGAISGLISITDADGTSPQKVTLTGNGLGAGKISISPVALSFGVSKVGTGVTKTLTLKNSGTATLTITGMTISGTNASDFKKANHCGSTIAVGATCTVDMTFTPGDKGARTGTLSISDNDAYHESPQTVTLKGTGN